MTYLSDLTKYFHNKQDYRLLPEIMFIYEEIYGTFTIICDYNKRWHIQ